MKNIALVFILLFSPSLFAGKASIDKGTSIDHVFMVIEGSFNYVASVIHCFRYGFDSCKAEDEAVNKTEIPAVASNEDLERLAAKKLAAQKW